MKSLTCCCAIVAVSLASCAQMTQLKNATVAGVSNLMPQRIPVVEVRQKDLKEIKTGRDQAVAFEKERRRGFWGSLFQGPVDFKEPELPVESASTDGEVLPPMVE